MKNCYIRSKSTKRPHVSTVAAQRCQAPTHYAYFRPSWPAGSAAASGDGTLGCRLVSRSTSTSANCVVSLITTQARACGTRCSWLVNHVVCLRLDCIPQRIQDVHAGARADGGEVFAIDAPNLPLPLSQHRQTVLSALGCILSIRHFALSPSPSSSITASGCRGEDDHVTGVFYVRRLSRSTTSLFKPPTPYRSSTWGCVQPGPSRASISMPQQPPQSPSRRRPLRFTLVSHTSCLWCRDASQSFTHFLCPSR